MTNEIMKKFEIKMAEKGIDISTSEVIKLQEESYTGIALSFGPVPAPVLRLDEFEQMAEKAEDEIVDAMMEKAEALLAKAATESFVSRMDFLGVYDEVRPRLFMAVVETERNKYTLRRCPHRSLVDMSAVCRVNVSEDDENIASALVTDSMMKLWGVTEEQLFADAYDNMSVELMDMGAIVPGADADCPIKIARTKGIQANGAGVIAMPNFCEEMARKFGKSFYLLPSSIHEVLLVPDDDMFSPEPMVEMVRDINRTQVSLQERLTDNAYYYNKDTAELTALAD